MVMPVQLIRYQWILGHSDIVISKRDNEEPIKVREFKEVNLTWQRKFHTAHKFTKLDDGSCAGSRTNTLLKCSSSNLMPYQPRCGMTGSMGSIPMHNLTSYHWSKVNSRGDPTSGEINFPIYLKTSIRQRNLFRPCLEMRASLTLYWRPTARKVQESDIQHRIENTDIGYVSP
ncbi:hypothetical protein FF38_05823 [Lucilia cuprina]|uniref:Uncharacterized protein n=1 Tax=Lucilia cuprina TaxID=7375 RepID=A0A0L0CMI2_LUCCU|nr:hypothetical protein FF38_05823 [Lucilia cuprina]